MKKPDSEIIRGLNEGDEKSFDQIFKLFQRQLSYFAYTILEDEEYAKDVVAEVFLKLWNLRTRFSAIAAIRSFLYIAVRNLCFDFLRTNKRREDNKKDYAYWASHQREVTEVIYTAELIEKIFQEIDALPPRQKEIFKMAFFEDLSSEQIAARLNITLKTVWNHKTAALKNLKFRFLKDKLTSKDRVSTNIDQE